VGAAGAGLATGAGFATTGGWSAIHRALAASERRNVVLIVIDSLRADHLHCYGARGMRTPNIDELARGSVCFRRVFP
jgi:Sulfatase